MEKRLASGPGLDSLIATSLTHLPRSVLGLERILDRTYSPEDIKLRRHWALQQRTLPHVVFGAAQAVFDVPEDADSRVEVGVPLGQLRRHALVAFAERVRALIRWRLENEMSLSGYSGV